MKYRKIPVEVEATQWFKNGDHPEDDPTRGGRTANGEYWEGLVVRYYRHPEVKGHKPCQHCRRAMYDHGWIDTLEGGHVVCPGDFVITGVAGEKYPCKASIFRETYEPVPEETA